VLGQVELRTSGDRQAEIWNLRVTPEFRRQRVGSALVQRALDTAKAQGFRSVRLEARPTESSISTQALVSLYQKHGFRSAGISQRGNPMLETHAAGGPVLPHGPSAAGALQMRKSAVPPYTPVFAPVPKMAAQGRTWTPVVQPFASRSIQRMMATRSEADILQDILTEVTRYNALQAKPLGARAGIKNLITELKVNYFTAYTREKHSCPTRDESEGGFDSSAR
jgi:Acetyltransferase (GNAT) domain